MLVWRSETGGCEEEEEALCGDYTPDLILPLSFLSISNAITEQFLSNNSNCWWNFGLTPPWPGLGWPHSSFLGHFLF